MPIKKADEQLDSAPPRAALDVTVTDIAMSSLKARLLSGSIWALAGRVLLAIVGLALNALLGRLLAPQDLGAFFLAFSVVSFFAVLSSLGLTTTVVRFVAENMGLGQPERARDIVVKSLLLSVSAATLVAVAYAIFGSTLASRIFGAPALAAIGGLTAAWILTLTLQSLLAETFRGFHDIRLAAVFSRSAAGFGSLMAGALLTMSLATLWVLGERVALRELMLLTVCSGGISVAVAGWLLVNRVKKLPVTPKREKTTGFSPILAATWPILVADVTLLALTQADIWVVGAFRGPEEVAIYGAAARLVALVVMPLLIVQAVVPPVIAEKHAQGRNEELQKVLRTTATLAGIPAFLVLLCFLLFGGEILGVVFGGYYAQGAVILAALSLGQLASVWTGPCGIALVMTGHQTLMMIITVFSGTATIVGALLSVGAFGATGVAVATGAGVALHNIAMSVGVKFSTGLRTDVSIRSLVDVLKAIRAG